jgi:hypothetical protein
MNVAARLLLFSWGAALATGCSSGPGTKSGEADAAGVVMKRDAARDRDFRGVVGTLVDAGLTAGPPDAPPDGRRDTREGRDAAADAAESDAKVPTHACSAGHTCTGNTRCQRACFGQLIYRCSCADGRFVCTGCIAVDGGVPDLRGGPATCATDVADGRRCEMAGTVCQQRADPQRLCACGDFGADRIWICQ